MKQLFTKFQQVGKAFMLPIALLPAAGILLGIGAAFTNETMLRAYGLQSLISIGTPLYTLLIVMKNCGEVVFNILPLLFAMGIAIGMAKSEKGTAGLAAAIGYFIMHTSISTILYLKGITFDTTSVNYLLYHGFTEAKAVAINQQYGRVLGIFTLQMNVFGGIIIGGITAFLHNKFYKIELPSFLGFFSGNRFVPIITAFTSIFVGMILVFVWPPIQTVIQNLGTIVNKAGYFGIFLYGVIERALIPFGLHHIFYMPFWQTPLGGSEQIAGQLVTGAQNIFFKQLANPATTHFSVNAAKYMSGKFPFMIFGLPAAAFAMYKTAKPEKKKMVGGLLLSAAITSALTGITEPLEFTFLFIAPMLFGIHVVLSGLSFLIMNLLNVAVGQTFSGGLIDLTLFGIIQGNAKTNWIMIPIVGILYALIYYSVFKFAIVKFDLKTPGREDDEEVKLYTKNDFINKNEEIKDNEFLASKVIKSLGGKENIENIDACITRLRVEVKDPAKVVDDSTWKKLGAKGVFRAGNGIQIIYGGKAVIIKTEIEEMINMK